MENSKQLDIIVQHIDNFTDNKIQDLITDFHSFDSFININILNYDLLRSHILLFHKLITRDVFYKSIEPVRNIFHYIFINIPMLKDVQSTEILSWLLNLMTNIIQKAKNFKNFKTYFQKQKGKCFERVSIILKLNFFHISYVNDFTSIIYEILMLDGYLDDVYSENFTEIINSLMEFKAYFEITVILEVVIEKYHISSEIFSVFSCWLLKNGCQLLIENGEEVLLLKILKALNCFYTKYDNLASHNSITQDVVKSGLQFLSENTETLISFLTKPSLRVYSTRLLAYILVSQDYEYGWDYMFKKLMSLPIDPSEWIHGDPELFLRICYLVCTNNRIILWSPNKILQAISSLIYSYQRYSIKTKFLKIICSLYPMMMNDSITKHNVILGDDLLIMMSRHYDLENIFSFHLSQLNWILRRGDIYLKKAAICYWLKNKDYFDVLRKCILSAKMEDLLINIIVDANLDSDISIEAAELIRNIENPNLKTKIAKMLPLVCDVQEVFGRLMICNPEVPEDKKLALKLSEFMSTILFFIVDEEIFGLVCDYSKKLVTYLKTDANIVNIFCRNTGNIIFMMKRLKKLSDTPAISLMGLLKVLLLVQKRNHASIDNTIHTAFAYVLSGSTIKLEKCLDVLYLLTTQRLFIRLTYESLNSVLLRLFSLCEDQELCVKSLICINEILKSNHWLATLSTTNFFVETHCSLAVDEVSWQQFVVFLTTWIKILKKRLQMDKQFYFAHTGIVRNYIKRLCGLPQERVNYLLKALYKFDRRKSPNVF